MYETVKRRMAKLERQRIRKPAHHTNIQLCIDEEAIPLWNSFEASKGTDKYYKCLGDILTLFSKLGDKETLEDSDGNYSITLEFVQELEACLEETGAGAV